MSKLVEFGTVSTETKQTYFRGTMFDGVKAPIGSQWYYKFTDSDPSQPMVPAEFG